MTDPADRRKTYTLYVGGHRIESCDARNADEDIVIGDGEPIVDRLVDFAERLSRVPAPDEEISQAWRAACAREAARVYPDFQQAHPYVVHEPDGTQITPGPGVAYPSLVAAYLEARTGVGGWRVELVRKTDGNPRWEFAFTPPALPSVGRPR